MMDSAMLGNAVDKAIIQFDTNGQVYNKFEIKLGYYGYDANSYATLRFEKWNGSSWDFVEDFQLNDDFEPSYTFLYIPSEGGSINGKYRIRSWYESTAGYGGLMIDRIVLTTQSATPADQLQSTTEWKDHVNESTGRLLFRSSTETIDPGPVDHSVAAVGALAINSGDTYINGQLTKPIDGWCIKPASERPQSVIDTLGSASINKWVLSRNANTTDVTFYYDSNATVGLMLVDNDTNTNDVMDADTGSTISAMNFTMSLGSVIGAGDLTSTGLLSKNGCHIATYAFGGDPYADGTGSGSGSGSV